MLRILHPDGDGLRNNNANRAAGIRHCSIACEPFQGHALRVAGFPLWLCRLETTLPAGVQFALEIYDFFVKRWKEGDEIQKTCRMASIGYINSVHLNAFFCLCVDGE